MHFLNHREGNMVFYQGFLLSPLQCTLMHYRNYKRLREFEEIEISRQSSSLEVTLNSKEENSSEFSLDFVQEFGLSVQGRQKCSLNFRAVKFGVFRYIFCIKYKGGHCAQGTCINISFNLLFLSPSFVSRQKLIHLFHFYCTMYIKTEDSV
jgi:hypothetical protein